MTEQEKQLWAQVINDSRWSESDLKRFTQKQSIKSIEKQKKNSSKVSKSTPTEIMQGRRQGLSEKGIQIDGSIPTIKKNKFNAKKKEIDGIIFDSSKEAGRYVDLKNQQQAGLIRDLRHQVEFELCVNGIKVCRYIADFVYTELKNCYLTAGDKMTLEAIQIVEDVKSAITRKHPVYILKRKLMKACHGIDIKEV